MVDQRCNLLQGMDARESIDLLGYESTLNLDAIEANSSRFINIVTSFLESSAEFGFETLLNGWRGSISLKLNFFTCQSESALCQWENRHGLNIDNSLFSKKTMNIIDRELFSCYIDYKGTVTVDNLGPTVLSSIFNKLSTLYRPNLMINKSYTFKVDVDAAQNKFFESFDVVGHEELVRHTLKSVSCKHPDVKYSSIIYGANTLDRSISKVLEDCLIRKRPDVVRLLSNEQPGLLFVLLNCNPKVKDSGTSVLPLTVPDDFEFRLGFGQNIHNLKTLNFNRFKMSDLTSEEQVIMKCLIRLSKECKSTLKYVKQYDEDEKQVRLTDIVCG